MAANRLVQAGISGEVKEDAAAVSAAKALPFAPLTPNAVTVEAMKEARKGGLPRFDSVEALMDDLHAPD